MRCSRCIFSDHMSGIKLNADKICNICEQIDIYKDQFGTGTKRGEILLDEILSNIRKSGKNKKYDCVIGVSGGTDSSYLLMKAVDWGLKPLAVHYDNTWNTAIATQNIRKITQALEVDLYTHVVNNKEHDAIKLAYLKAGVQEFDTDTDLAFVQVLRSAAAKFGVKYILEGHSFMEEGISPAANNYFDGAYIKDIVDKFSAKQIDSYPLMSFWQFMKWLLIYRQIFIRPLWYISYTKEDAKKELASRTGWVDYSGHHLENRASAFAHEIWIYQKFNTDYRILTLAAKVRNGIIKRSTALNELSVPRPVNPELLEYVLKRLELTYDDFEELLYAPSKSWRDFRTYKKTFERLEPLFRLLASLNMVPKSFHAKYCFPLE